MELSEEGGQSAKQPKDVTPDGFTYQATPAGWPDPGGPTAA
jgi:hypothetical protein